jgi:hypothetical protein
MDSQRRLPMETGLAVKAGRLRASGNAEKAIDAKKWRSWERFGGVTLR